MSDTYDTNNIFAQILRGEAPCAKVYEDDFVMAFNDIAEMAPVHVLVIPKGQYINLDDFLEKSSDNELTGFWRGVSKTIEVLNISQPGFNLFTSIGSDHGQDVFHFHVHLDKIRRGAHLF